MCFVLDIVNCPACGQPKLAHHLCAFCYTSLTRKWKVYGWSSDYIEGEQIEQIKETTKQPEELVWP
jgi:ribosomal protein L32